MKQDPPLARAPLRDQSFDAVIFDLGGVILPLFPERTVTSLSELFGRDASALYTQAAQTQLFDQFERGEVSAAEFRMGISDALGRTVSENEFDAAWNAMLGSLPLSHLDFLLLLTQRKRTFVLSNTNEIHVRQFLADFERHRPDARHSFSDHFEAVHYSHELGMRKPEHRIFEELIKRHNLVPERTLFLDDNPKNVSAACATGLLGVHHPTNEPLIGRFTP